MDGNSSHAGRVGKLLKEGLTSKRPWKKQSSKESFGSTASSEDVPRGRSPHSRDPFYDDDKSESTLSTQLSHSTEKAEEEAEEDDNVSPLADEYDSEPLSPSATYSVSVSSKTSSPEPTSQLVGSKTSLLQPQSIASRRAKSPAGRIKDAFKSKKSSSQVSDRTEKTDFANPDQVTTSSGSQTSQTVASTSDTTNDATVVSSEPSRRFRGHTPQPINTSRPPRTPPPQDRDAPVIVNTPPTPTDHNQPGQQGSPVKSAPPEASVLSSNSSVVVSPSGNMISHRRGRSRSGSGASIGPSKLSISSLAPLTPTPENAGPLTPGGGFFSSMISAAQNAANTLSNSVATANINIGGNQPKTPIPAESQEGDGDTTEVETSAGQPVEGNMGEPAVKTLGQGDLSLSHLGIQEAGSAAPTPQASRFPDHVTDTRSRSESAPDHPVGTNTVLLPDDLSVSRPRSLYESVGDQTPPPSVYEGKTGIHRSGSIRSAIGRRRKRGSTGGTAGTNGTGTTIGAAIAAANASVAHPNAAGSVPKLTGFAVASKKRNRDFHSLFKSVPDDDYLIEDYSCALQREILAHGRLYVSEGHLCFSSNILGWVTTLVMSFDEIVSLEKRSTALVFKNGLMISTLHAKHVFASFTSRDSTYDLIVNIWKLTHPTLRSSLNGVSLDETGGDKTERADNMDPPADHSGSGSDVDEEEGSAEDDDDVYDEDEEDDDALDIAPTAETNVTDTEVERAVARKVSGAIGANGPSEKPTNGAPAPTSEKDYPGPAAHAPTDCGDAATHYERLLGDEIIPAPLGKIYSLIFGPASVTFMAKWLTGEQKCTDLQMEDKIGLTPDNKSRGYTYIKPLNSSIGPKQTKCVVTETLENIDLEKAVNILIVTQNPDVPNGNLFSVKTKYCLHWAENNSTRVQVNCTIEWTGKSWLKGPIEKGANDGQIQYCKDLFASLKAAVSSRPRSATLLNGAPGKGKKRKGRKLHKASKESLNDATVSTANKAQDWGLLEPLHGILGPVVDIIKPILTGNVVYGLLVGLLVASWFGFGFNPRQDGGGYGPGIGFPAHPDRLIAYEEVWRREESDLWDWLEERVGLHRMSDDPVPQKKRVVEPRTVEDKLREDRMNEREVEEAIRVTEEKLQVLKQSVAWKSEEVEEPVKQYDEM
ncbi:hypothetical protein BJ170DRAFT_700427 [Xylariales sp. AK1849]|nr:hypothetical protein BJ170DRAFT_700427 [Xylariales sp. AK1849]